MALVAKRRPRETWRDAVERAGAARGVSPAWLSAFEALINNGLAEAEAAYRVFERFGGLESVTLPGETGGPSPVDAVQIEPPAEVSGDR